MARRRKHLLIGRAVHTFDERGAVELQGEIIDVDATTAVVQTFEWIAGEDSAVVLIPLSDFALPGKLTLYRDVETMPVLCSAPARKLTDVET
jgi:hypothetical protein